MWHGSCYAIHHSTRRGRPVPVDRKRTTLKWTAAPSDVHTSNATPPLRLERTVRTLKIALILALLAAVACFAAQVTSTARAVAVGAAR
jgi:hypothetical protein